MDKQHLEFRLTPEQQLLNDLWEEHLRGEFTAHDTESTINTMVADAYVNHIPVLTGGVGHNQLREFYSRHFIPKMPPDTEIVPISRTIGVERLVDEMIFRFTHTLEMDWMLPGVAPTGKRVECGLVVIVHFRGKKLSSEHIYWDQASVLGDLLPKASLSRAAQPADIALTGVRTRSLCRTSGRSKIGWEMSGWLSIEVVCPETSGVGTILIVSQGQSLTQS